ncbi:1A family penicillin-binding protein [Gracilibacillus halotolerans]|uniref:1A family penicillin-binding protein n=1 Tax=Gracilibacillus halotolerans TaxID=74386 RepID=A0A841RMC4_9BACI|nr:transglycosylase domain-containing protein [Gracilibacillus halotolerans]MBB6513072.1 1A family penicillin-binding protein [Gracilibacillus halotolerans]
MKRKRRRKKKYRLLKIVIFLFLLGGSCLAVLLIASFLLGPPLLERSENTVYYSQDEEVIGETYGNEKRYWVPLSEIDDKLEQAVITTEDQHFYQHFGFDFKRLAGAIWKDIQTWSFKEGASTITQQYARNLFLSHDKTIQRKLYEAFYTIRLEMFYEKDELLEGYLNTIYFGHGAYGIEAASRYYFDKPADELSWAEAALLAGVPKGPSNYSPFNNMEKAISRQQHILKNLLDKEVIDQETYDQAIEEELQFSEERTIVQKGLAPYFQDVVEQELVELLELPEEDIRSGGYRIYTTLQTGQQEVLNQVIDRTLQDEEIQVGAMAMDPVSGAVTALVGGTDYEASPFNRVTQAQRMPGSAFKPILYYTALENGLTPASTMMSKPTVFQLEDGETYQPSNYNGYYANEPITMAQALALSDNIFAVKTNLYVTPERLVRVAKEKFGIDSKLSAVPSLALGTEAVNVQEIVTAYSILANGGKDVEPYTVEKVLDAQGNLVYDRNEKLNKQNNPFPFFGEKEENRQVLRADLAYILSEMMKGMFDTNLNGYMSVTGSSITNELEEAYSGKSGTTASDNWMIGFSPLVSAGVWIGYDDNRRITRTAEEAYSKNIWADFMREIHRDTPVQQPVPPDNVVEVMIDLKTGLVANENCSQAYPMLFVKGTEPKKQCTLHLDEHDESDENTEQVINEDHLLENWWEWLWTGEETQQ